MECFSHPGKRLIQHLENVKVIGTQILSENRGNFSSITPPNLQTLVETTLRFHDIGKSTLFFQDYLQSAIEKRKSKYKTSLTSHSLLSACIAAYYLQTQIPHEKSIFLSLLTFLAIKKHHGNLENIDEMTVVQDGDWRILEKQWANILCDFKSIVEQMEFDKVKEFVNCELFSYLEKIKGNIENFFILVYLFSLLVYSDKTDVVGYLEKKEFSPGIVDFIDNYKIKKFGSVLKSEINMLREEAYSLSLKNLSKNFQKQNIFSLNLPTGAGKTLTVLNLAFNLLEKDKTLKRIIYALPFTSIVDQTEKVIREIFEKNNEDPDDFLTVHHHLAEVKIKNDENYIEGDKAEFLIENWDKPFILTTFWQLFHSIITNKNSQLRKFHNLANSVIILDEVQSIPYRYWQLTNEVFKKLTELFNIKIIFLTATMPLIFDEKKEEIVPLIPLEKRKEYFAKFSRYEICVLNKLEDINIDGLFKIAKKEIKNTPNKSFLFVFNTIKTSVDFYKKVEEEFEGNPQTELIYLSSNIIPVERKKRIEKIKKAPGRKIIVSTQVVEAGVDIDLDIVYRDFAPLDSIIQCAGRCNRNNEKDQGKLVLFKLKNEDGKCDYRYIYKGLTVDATMNLFENIDNLSESEVLFLIERYYQSIVKSSSDEGMDIVKAMKNLNFEYMARQFRLIEEIPSFLVFLEIDEEAGNVLKQFREIIQKEDRFERKSEFLKIKNKFYQYVVSVRENIANKMNYQSLEEKWGIKIIERGFVENFYDLKTGIKREIDTDLFL